MKNILITSFDMEVGGVERSLINLLSNFDYSSYQVDLLLYSHTGDFLTLLPTQPTLLKENKTYKTFRMSIKETLLAGNLPITFARTFAKVKANRGSSLEKGYKQMQYMWKYSIPFLPKVEKEYDAAISYLWPHDFVAKKVKAKKKIAWIHTDYSTVDTDEIEDLKIWDCYQSIIAVSTECKKAFLSKYPSLYKKVVVIENLNSPEFIRSQAKEKITHSIIDDNRFKIVTVARLSHAKGIDNGIKALKEIKNRGYSDIAWYVVGYGGDDLKLKKLIKDNGLEKDFILIGKQVNPYPYVKEADIYVQPSRYEGKAITVTEAQILSKPVLITDYPTSKSQVQDGRNGLICEGTVEGIAGGIEQLYKNREIRKKLKSFCLKTDFSVKREMETFYKLI
ncbi:glycosyltransferase [Jeotgalibacillus sp. ET6]|uniref:glycosyltransferase n=1 Tax=Jeotgalibacillus sp. ET6 TaxID=3037260 RepID=UPI00241851AB|nr:glycosyltransferase [Jeotgalibacillus sp. ET6]MDG5472614.1 glycosyltransferase [Jeotgalibacillus sp. ET6]